MDMERKEEIIQATFMLASKNGIDNVSMSQIATQLGIKKPSLYNHFRSKDEIAKAMYDYLRTQAKEKLKITDLDYGKLVKDKSLEEVLKLAVHNYCKMSTQSEMFSFYKIIFPIGHFEMKDLQMLNTRLTSYKNVTGTLLAKF